MFDRLKRVRKMTWTIWAWNVLMAAWIIGGVSSAATTPETNCGVLDTNTCNGAADVGTAIGAGLLVFLWFMGFVVLSLAWFMTRPKNA